MQHAKLSLLAAMSLLVGCAGSVADSVAPTGNESQAKVSGSRTDSKAIWFWYSTMSDNSPALFYGDGLAADGATPAEPSVYEDSRCAVRATINWYGSANPTGNAFFGPTSQVADVGCPNRRYQRAVIAGAPAVAVNWPGYVNNIMQIPLGGTITEDVMWGPTNNLPCARIRYVVTAGSGVIVKRTAGNSTGLAGEWTVESTGSHLAQCWVFVRANTLAWDAAHTTYLLPFRARIVEVRQ